MIDRSNWAQGILLAALAALYAPVFIETAHLWQTDEYSTHGAFIPLLSGLLIWWKRKELSETVRRPSAMGFAPLVFGLLLQALGWYTRIPVLATVSLIPVLLGVTLLVAGTKTLRILLFPILFLVFAAPMPRWIVQPISLPIQTLSAHSACTVVRALGVPLVEQGFNVQLTNTTVEVAESCSGFKKSLSLIVFGCFYSALFAIPFWRQAILVALALPIALVANVIRVSALVLCGSWWGSIGVTRFHDPSEMLVLMLCIGLLFSVGKALGCKKIRYLA